MLKMKVNVNSHKPVEQLSFQYSFNCSDIVSPSYVVWKLIPDRRAGDEKNHFSELGRHTKYFKISRLMRMKPLTVKQRRRRDECIDDICQAPVYCYVHHET